MPGIHRGARVSTSSTTKGRTEVLRRKTTLKRRAPPRKRSRLRRGRVHDRKYLAWLAAQPCLVTARRPVTVHHVRRFGEPKHDRRTLPLVPELHQLQNEIKGIPCIERGKAIFEEFWGVNIEAAILAYNARYEAEHRRKYEQQK